MSAILLGIETSCDETSAAVWKEGKGILSNIIATQDVHTLHGGVVPELASRAHQQHIVPVVEEALRKAGVDKKELNAIAYTIGPGLIGALLVGSHFAKSLALALHIQLLPIDHMDAHRAALFIDPPVPTFPFLCLTVSGGHTQIVQVEDIHTAHILGTTRDDAVGEAFDKVAKMLGLAYPGGPLVDRWAQQGDPLRFTFPISTMPGLDFSFSGIKTAVLYFIRQMEAQSPGFVQANLADLCASVQHTLVKTLMDKVEQAVKTTGIRHVAVAGGVSANSALRASLKKYTITKGWVTYAPKLEYCTDNAAMVAMAGWFRYLHKDFGHMHDMPYARRPSMSV